MPKRAKKPSKVGVKRIKSDAANYSFHKDPVAREFSHPTSVKGKALKPGPVPDLFISFDPLKGKQFQILDSNGKLVNKKYEPKLSKEVLKQMYQDMVFSKAGDAKALKLQRQGRMGTYASVRGQEAAQVGPCSALTKEDWVVPAFREVAATHARDRENGIKNLFIYWMGNEIGMHNPEGVEFLPVSVPIATHMLHATGIGWGLRLKKEKKVALAFFGDGGTSEGDFHEALNFAGVFNANTVFVCQNNQWAISLPRVRQTASVTIAQKAVAYGIPGIQVDGNDVLAMFVATKAGADRARKGQGACLIEAYTYRLSDHTTADDASRYRQDKEVKEWIKKDPITRFEKYLLGKKVIDNKFIEKTQSDAEEFANKVTKDAEAQDAPKVEDVFKWMYHDMNSNLQEQLDYLNRVLESKPAANEGEH